MFTDRSHKAVLVAGATGRVGVLVEILLARGHSVRAMTRAPHSPAAARLRGAGADVVYGDFDDPSSVALAAAGADTVFATGTAHKSGPEGELRHGRAVAEAAVSAGIPHLVYMSGDGAGPDSPLPLFRVKHQVEEQIRSLPIAHTILAPVYFMENLFNPWNLVTLKDGVFPSPTAVDAPLQQVAIADVASFAAVVIERPEEFAGRRIAIASDELSAEQAAAELSRVVGRAFGAERLSDAELAPGLRALFGWLEAIGHNVDVGAVRRRYPEVRWHSYASWLRTQRLRLREICPRDHTFTTR